MIVNTTKIRAINKQLIRTHLRNNELSTKHTISNDTGLSVASCTNILKELLHDGEVIEIEKAESTGGRPSRQFKYNDDYAHCCLIYLRKEDERKSIFGSIIDMGANEIYSDETIYEDIKLQDIFDFVSKIVTMSSNIRIIYLGIPGVVDNGVIGVCDYPELSGIEIERELKQMFNIDSYAVNDMNATALGYYSKNRSINAESFVYIYYPKNGIPGSGIIVNGKMIYGNNHFAGEFSFLPTIEDRDKHGEIQQDKSAFLIHFIKILGTFVSILNPKCITISGDIFTNIDLDEILELISKTKLKSHLPKIVIEEDIQLSYLEGLRILSFEKMGCNIELVKK